MRRVLLFMLMLACKENDSATHEAVTHHAWFKKPAQIELKLREWGINITDKDRQLYFVKLGLLYGATSTATQKTYLHDKPVTTYVLALNIVSDWISNKLVTKQQALEAEENNTVGVFMFKGMGLPAATGKCDEASGNNYCFAADNHDVWCDCDDQVKIGRYTRGDAPPSPNTPVEHKRIMHNMQDIGEFLGITLDNCSPSPDPTQYQHMPQYLLDAVFLPTINDKNEIQDEIAAWQKVIHTMLLGGEFFMNIDTRRNKLCQ